MKKIIAIAAIAAIVATSQASAFWDTDNGSYNSMVVSTVTVTVTATVVVLAMLPVLATWTLSSP